MRIYRGLKIVQFEFIRIYFYFKNMFLVTADVKQKKNTCEIIVNEEVVCILRTAMQLLRKPIKWQGALRYIFSLYPVRKVSKYWGILS